MDLFTAITERYSFRGMYSDAPVAREHLKLIMEAGAAAPSGCNMQTTSFIAIDDPDLLKRVSRLLEKPAFESAPAAICVLSRELIAYGDRTFCVEDAAASIENMLLAITALGYASCWIEGHITDRDRIGRQMADILGVPEEYELMCYLPVGVPAEAGKRVKKQPFCERAWFNGFKNGVSE